MALFHSELAGGAPTENRRRSNLQCKRRRWLSLPFRPSTAGGAIHESTTFPLPSPFRTLQGLSRCARGEDPSANSRNPGRAGGESPPFLLPRRIGEHLLPPLIPLPSVPLLPTLRCVGSVSRRHRLLSRIPPLPPCSLLRFRPSSFIQLRLSKKAR